MLPEFGPRTKPGQSVTDGPTHPTLPGNVQTDLGIFHATASTLYAAITLVAFSKSISTQLAFFNGTKLFFFLWIMKTSSEHFSPHSHH